MKQYFCVFIGLGCARRMSILMHRSVQSSAENQDKKAEMGFGEEKGNTQKREYGESMLLLFA